MEAKKIMPCLDINKGRVVKGVKFVDLKDAGDPVEAAKAYEAAGADELAMLDITATTEGRENFYDLVAKVSSAITIPLSVGGGIRTAEEFGKALEAGASKVSINSAAVADPELIREVSGKYGSEKVVIAIDVNKKADGNGWSVITHGGNRDSGIDAVEWARKCEALGAGALLVTSKDADGTKEGYDIPLTAAIAEAVNIPVIASGGAGKKEDFLEALTTGKAEVALAASLFHFKEIEIPELKKYLSENGVKVNGIQ